MKKWSGGVLESWSGGNIRGKFLTANKIVFTLALCTMLFALCTSVEAQQPKNVHRIGFQSAGTSAGRGRLFARDCVNWVTSKDRTSSLNGDLRKERRIRSHAMRLSWSG